MGDVVRHKDALAKPHIDKSSGIFSPSVFAANKTPDAQWSFTQKMASGLLSCIITNGVSMMACSRVSQVRMVVRSSQSPYRSLKNWLVNVLN